MIAHISLLALVTLVFGLPASLHHVIRRGGKGGSRTKKSGGKSRRNRSFTTEVCFPGTAIVKTLKKGYIPICELQIGESVRVQGGWSQVYLFSHREPSGNAEYLAINAPPRKITMTASHHILTRRGQIAARSVLPGDFVFDASGSPLRVTSVRKNEAVRGLFSPQTLQGTIVVDGIIASTFTESVQANCAHGLLAPVRAFYFFFGLDAAAGALEKQSVLRTILVDLGRRSGIIARF